MKLIVGFTLGCVPTILICNVMYNGWHPILIVPSMFAYVVVGAFMFQEIMDNWE